MGIGITYRAITKKYGQTTVVKNADFSVKPGELFTLLGPSGCGKTTLLRMTAGFASIEGGEIFFDDEVINTKPAHQRNIGMVFQNYAIFPHLSVEKNVAFGLKTRRIDKESIRRRVMEAMAQVKIEGYRDRSPTNLSGGQQQRIALARAIVINPDLLLMDEPLSNLDAQLRVEMRTMIAHLQMKLGITTVYVTHDQEEALSISDRLAVMRDGVILQIDSPERIYDHPANIFVANFIGVSNILDGRVLEARSHTYTIQLTPTYTLEVPRLTHSPGNRPVKLSVRPDSFRIQPPSHSGIKGKVYFSTYLGNYMQYFIQLESGGEAEVWQYHDEHQPRIPIGDNISLAINARRVNVFDESGESNLGETEQS